MTDIEARGFGGGSGGDDDRVELQKLRDRTLYEYMDTLVNTAKIGLEAQIKQSRISASADGNLAQTIEEIRESMERLRLNTAS